MPDFGVTSLVLVTTDHGMADRLLNAISGVRPRACQLAIEQARIQLRLVEDTTNRLIADGHALYNPNDPKTRACRSVHAPRTKKTSFEARRLDDQDGPGELRADGVSLAWSEARRAGRTLRHLMAARWSKAYGDMAKVVAPEPPKPPRPRQGRLSVDELAAEREVARNRTPILLLPLASPRW